ncbi:MAG: biotin/lipoate A/B protein ligase family protein [Thermoleophilia bacterium]
MDETWVRLGPAALPPAEAVALPIRLLDGMGPGGPPVLSWSTVTAPGLVLGRHAVDPDLDRDAVAAEGVTVAKRSSGGGPVLWDGDLVALDVVLPRGHRLAADDVVAAYRWLGEALADALRALGVPGVEVVDVARARAAAAAPGAAADACFGGLSPWEVLAGGRKVVGLSQTRRHPGALLQAGVPLRLDAARLGRLLGRDDAWAQALAATAAGVREMAPDVTAADVVAAVEAAITAREGVALDGTRSAGPGSSGRGAHPSGEG